MSKKMKKVSLDSSSYGSYEDARAMFKHQTLLQDYQELEKEAQSTRSKLEAMKQKKLTLLAEVRFLRQRYKYLMNNEPANSVWERELFQWQNIETQLTIAVNEKNTHKKEARLRNATKVSIKKQKEKIFVAKESACLNPSRNFDLNRKDRMPIRKEAFSRNTSLDFDLNQKEKAYIGDEAMFHNPTAIVNLNLKERLVSGKATTSRSPARPFDKNQIEGTYIKGEDAVQNRAPIFDLNLISEEEGMQDNNKPLRVDEAKKVFIGTGTDEQLRDLKISTCRNFGNGSNPTGKRKVSWQDQVALKV